MTYHAWALEPDPAATFGVRARPWEGLRVRLSVIIPVYDGQAVLPHCLRGLGASTRSPDEVIVVDDCSTDESPAIAGALQATVISTPGGPRGPAYARNRGAALASGDVLVFVDADVVVHTDTLARMAATFEARPGLTALFGSYDESPPAPGLVSRFKNLLHHYVHQRSKRDAGSFWAGCGAIRRDAFLAVSGFDERYRRPSVEDIELGLRLTRAGLSIRLCPEIQATHLKHWSLASLWQSDVFARAVPWTRLVLREAHVPDDLNLTWRSRVSAVFTWTALVLLVAALLLLALGRRADGGETLLGALCCLSVSTGLNAELHYFFLRRGGVRFATGAWFLHHAYFLYSSAVFIVLVVEHALEGAPAPRTARTTQHVP
jgi:GT2 family glycosyltransferase